MKPDSEKQASSLLFIFLLFYFLFFIFLCPDSRLKERRKIYETRKVLLWGQWKAVKGQEEVMGPGYDQITLYTCIK